MNFPDWINKVSLAVNKGDTEYVWKNMYLPIQREVMCIIDCFVEEAPPVKSPWKK